jgi:hypothetical protein
LGGQAFARLHHSTARPFDFTRCVDGKCCAAARFPLAADAAQAARPPPTTRAAAARSSQGAAGASPCAAAPTQPPALLVGAAAKDAAAPHIAGFQYPVACIRARISLQFAKRRKRHGGASRAIRARRSFPYWPHAAAPPSQPPSPRRSVPRFAGTRRSAQVPPRAAAHRPRGRTCAPRPGASTTRGYAKPRRSTARPPIRRRFASPPPGAGGAAPARRRHPPGFLAGVARLRIQNHVLPDTSRFDV